MYTVVEGTGDEPGFSLPVRRRSGPSGVIQLGPFAVALVFLAA